MGDCEKGLVEVCNPNGSNYFVSGCWRGYNTQYRKMDDCKTLKCKHSFHKECLIPWLKHEDRCPICSEKMQDINV